MPVDAAARRPSSIGFAEVVLVVADVPKAAAFYRDVVGLAAEVEANAEWAWFWAGVPGRSQRLALRHGPLLFEEFSPHPAGQRWGPVHFALDVPRDAVDAAVARARAAGVEVHGPTRLDWMCATSWYLYDLDGNLVEYWSPDSPREAESS